jgi:mono/diheme cytochrome c family protein
MKLLRNTLLFGAAIGAIAALVIYLAIFDVAADVPHSVFATAVIELVRDRSIAARSKDVQVPPLDDSKLIEEGARHYAEMCVGCHLAPGRKESELRNALYPKPPDLTARFAATPAEEFWVIKHGIKMSAMPAWGATHDDRTIWAIVAFVTKLPELTPDRYQVLAGTSEEADHHHHSHSHN